jgi:protein ImuB
MADRAAIVVHANRVVARSEAAAAEGVGVGQRRRDAQRCCPDAVLVDHDPDRDARAFEPLVHAVAQSTARLEVAEPGCLHLAARGPARYFGGEAELADRLVEHARASTPGVDVRVGIADGRFTAAVAAQLAEPDRPCIVDAGGAAAFLAPLPVAWLHRTGELDGYAGSAGASGGADLVGLLGRLGLHRLGDLAALSPATVGARFGPIGRHALRLATGGDDRPLDGREPPPQRAVEQLYDEPVERLEPLVFMAKHLADDLVARLSADGLTCTRLVVTAETAHNERTERAWYRAGGLSAAAMVERVRWHLGSWIDTTQLSAGVTLLRLTPDLVRPDNGHQPGLWGGRSDADTAAVRTVARLSGMLGDEAVTVPAWHGGYLPGDRYEWVPAATSDLTDADITRERLRPSLRDKDTRTGPWPGSLPAAAAVPIALHDPPRPAMLSDAAGHPLGVDGRGELTGDPALLAVDDRPPRPVTKWAGPWPVLQAWWDPARQRRVARLQLVTDDGSAYLAIAERQRWWVVATYA